MNNSYRVLLGTAGSFIFKLFWDIAPPTPDDVLIVFIIRMVSLAMMWSALICKKKGE